MSDTKPMTNDNRIKNTVDFISFREFVLKKFDFNFLMLLSMSCREFSVTDNVVALKLFDKIRKLFFFSFPLYFCPGDPGDSHPKKNKNGGTVTSDRITSLHCVGLALDRLQSATS